MNMKKIYAVLCSSALALTVVGCSPSSSSTTQNSQEATKVSIKEMSGEDLAKIQSDDKEKENYLLIDVRSADEYNAGHIKHAINIAVGDVKNNIEKLKDWKEKAVILYCNTGKKSKEAADILVAEGFKNVTNAKGVKEFNYDLVKYTNVMGADFQKAITEGKGVFIDVRDAKDYDKGHVKDAISADVKKLDELKDKLPADKNTPIYTYCYSGNRSAKAAQKAIELGYTNVTNAIDGTKEFEYKF
ncbi:rhodanese-like domain-containing protein [Gemelliphila palaticanis]|nr:rhodanese-like domain-containing protein [Gemella palaticanis]